MNIKTMSAELLKPFKASDVEWRIANTNKDKTSGIAVPYINSRAIQYRLDEVVGIDNWKTEFIPWHANGNNLSQLCKLSIYFTERSEWIAKCDGAENTDIEPIKGGISDSFKRAAVMWGVGRYLYSMETIWVNIKPLGRGHTIADGEQKKLDLFYERSVKQITGIDTPKSQPQIKATELFDYSVKKVEAKTFTTGEGYVLELVPNGKKTSFTAYLSGVDKSLVATSKLANVVISDKSSTKGSPIKVLEQYKIVA